MHWTIRPSCLSRICLAAVLAWVMWVGSKWAVGQSTPSVLPDGPSMLQVEGDADQLFLVFAQVVPTQGTGRSEAAAVYRRRAGGADWQFLGIVGGRPSDLGIWRSQLTVLMTDGTWRTVYEGGSSAGVLPRDGRLIRLAGEGATLVGLLSFEDDVVVGRLVAGRWEVLGGVPESARAARPPAVDLALQGGRLILAWAAEGGASVSVAVAGLPTSESVQLTWEPLGAVRPDETTFAVRVLRVGDGFAVWADPGTTSGGQVFIPVTTGEADVGGAGGWRSFSLGEMAGEAAAFAGRVRLFYRPPEATTRPSVLSMPKVPAVMERVFTLEGQEVGSPQPVTLVSGPGQEDLLRLVAVGVGMGGLMSALLLSWRRRAELSPEQIMAAFQLPLASRFKRLSAGLIDSSPFIVVSAYLVVTEGVTFGEYVLTPRAMFYELLGIAVVVTHVMLSEVIVGRSLGKAIFGLRVTDFAGQRPPPGRLVLRSLFRAVDLILVVPLMTVAISPLRQSIGDGAAGTLVLEDSPELGVSRKPDEDENG